MDTCICDISALKFWRTPPVVRLLVAGPADSPLLRRCVAEDELMSFRTGLYSSLPFCGCFADGPRWHRYCGQARTLREQFMVLAPSLDAPVDILAFDSSKRRTSKLLRPRLWSGEVPHGSIQELTDELTVSSPEFALQQFAARASWARTFMIVSELCGSFAIYEPPAPIKSFMQGLVDRQRLPSCGGWEPCLSNGQLTNLWTRAPLTTPEDILAFAQNCESLRGKAKLCKVAKLVKPNAASPLEVQAGMLLGLPRRLGGEGYSDFEYNTKVVLDKDARALAQRGHCYCDLFWEDAGLDIECQGAMVHNSWDSFVSDFDRATALGQMGIRVMLATSTSLFDTYRWDAFADAVAIALGKPRKPKTSKEIKAEYDLRQELETDWGKLLTLKDSRKKQS